MAKLDYGKVAYFLLGAIVGCGIHELLDTFIARMI